MESILSDETPLAAYLEGEGIADSFLDDQDVSFDSSPPTTPSFAPVSDHGFRNRTSRKLPQPLRLRTPAQGSLSKLHTAWSRAVNSRIGRTENTQFIEHFRYIIVASQLLSEYPDQSFLRSSTVQRCELDGAENEPSLHNVATSLNGVIATAAVAFVLVCLIHWAKSAPSRNRLLLVLAVFAVLAVVSYGYFRRQWLKYLRHQAVESASGLTTNLQAFEVSATAMLSLVQEVELVNKGYRMSFPLPPISRLEDPRTGRKCGRQRRVLQRAYAAIVPEARDAVEALKILYDIDDLEKYLEIYDVPNHVIQEALIDFQPIEDEDAESLKSLRLVSYQYNTLRRVILCSLLSLQADGGKPDFARWRAAVDIMQNLSATIANWAEKLGQLLQETEEFSIPLTPKVGRPANDRLRNQVRKITSLSQGIRGLQAKMALLREESNKSVEESDDLTDLGPHLMAQYESIGADLKALMQAWETGKASLANNIDKQERRISLQSISLRSPVSSLGGLTAVEEGTPEDALRALTGEPKSNRSSLATTPDEEVFEAIALPRQRERSSLTREQRIAKMHEERQRQASLREKRESNTSMLRELESVINLRPRPGRNSIGRITSI